MTDSEKLDLVLEKITDVDGKVGFLDKKVVALSEKVEPLDKKVIRLENDVTDIKLTVENEIRVNIQRVAERQFDLSRKLNECIKLLNDIKDKHEIYDIYINMHNNKLKALEV